MKKKIVALVLLVALLCVSMLTGCTFIKVNEERKANEVMATVSMDYDGQNLSLTVTRNELISYVNYIINLYSQYGMSYDAKSLVEQGLDALISQKYNVLNGMVYLLSLDNRKEVLYKDTAEYKSIYGTRLTPEGVLTIAERYSAIASTNESFVESIDTYVEEYETEQRELLVSSAREELAALYAEGYSVKEEGVAIYHLDGEEYVAGLYQDSFIYDASLTSTDSSTGETTTQPETDYKQIYLKIDLTKGSEERTVYLPISSTAVTTEVDEEAEFVSNYITAKICKVTYDEPVKDEDGEDTYKTHTAEASFTLVTPRTAYSEKEEEDTRDDATILNEGDVKYRYASFSGELSEELQKIADEGQIFKHTYTTYTSDAEKDAYRQFREEKKNMYIGFDATVTDDPYNTLGYYYLSAFESAVLSAVQHELKRAALTESPVTDAQIEEQYNILVNKQKEEYDILSAEEQVKKFAETIGTDLTSAYYVPIDALLSESFEYNGSTYNYATENADGSVTINMFYISHILFKWDENLNALMANDDRLHDQSDEDLIKEIKTEYLNYLKTNKSKLDFATAEEEGTTLADAFFVNEDGTIAEFSVLDVVAELKEAMAASENPFEVFKEYMTYFNDDSGSMTSSTGYFVAMGDIEHSYDGDDFPNMAIDLYLKLLADGVNPNNSSYVSEYAFTSYGMHIETISFAPFYRINLTDNNGLGVNFALDLDGTVFADSIKDALETNVANKVYSEWTAKYSSEDALNHAVKNEKKLKSLLKDLGL